MLQQSMFSGWTWPVPVTAHWLCSQNKYMDAHVMLDEIHGDGVHDAGLVMNSGDSGLVDLVPHPPCYCLYHALTAPLVAPTAHTAWAATGDSSPYANVGSASKRDRLGDPGGRL